MPCPLSDRNRETIHCISHLIAKGICHSMIPSGYEPDIRETMRFNLRLKDFDLQASGYPLPLFLFRIFRADHLP